jgi:hypothetical protein
MYGQEPDGLVLDAYWIALRDWKYDDFEQAAQHLMATATFMPRPADFNALRHAGEPTAAEAWTAVLEACVDWRDPTKMPNGRVARAAASVGGFRAIAMADVENDLPHIQRRFLEAYEGLTDVESVRRALPEIAIHSSRVALKGPTHIGALLPEIKR